MNRTAKISLTALVALLLFVLLVAIPYSAIQPVHIPIEKHPAELGLAVENFQVQPDDEEIDIMGWWMPAVEARASLLFIHGGGSARHSSFFDSVPFYADMVAQGINVAAIDLRNHGLSGDSEAGVQFGATEKYDALAAVDFVRAEAPHVPVYLMGISMGGATAIHAAASGADVQGLILLDPLLHTTDVFARGGTVQTGLPSAWFLPSAWAAERFFGFPSGERSALSLAERLETPMLLMQDPDDPVTRAVHAVALAERNPAVALWMAQPIPDDHPDLARRGRWHTHVMAYVAFPDAFNARVLKFIDDTLATHDSAAPGVHHDD